jgi:hypothetical protein
MGKQIEVDTIKKLSSLTTKGRKRKGGKGRGRCK